MLTIDIQRLLCTVIKFHVVKGAKGPTIRKLMWRVMGGGVGGDGGGGVEAKYKKNIRAREN